MSTTVLEIKSQKLASIYKAINQHYAANPYITTFSSWSYLQAILNCGPSSKLTLTYNLAPVPSQCGMYNISGTSLNVSQPHNIVAWLNQAKLYALQVNNERKALYPESARVIATAQVEMIDALMPLAKDITDEEIGVTHETLQALFDKFQKELKGLYPYHNQFILTDNIVHADCFAGSVQNYSGRPSSIVNYLKGIVIRGPLTCNHNHRQAGYIQTYIWIPEGMNIVQEDEDPTFGVRIQVSGKVNPYVDGNSVSAKTYFDTQKGDKVTLVNEGKKEVLDNKKKEKFPKNKKKSAVAHVEELRPEVH